MSSAPSSPAEPPAGQGADPPTGERGDPLTCPPPRLSVDDAARTAARLFGRSGTVTPLGAERDQNFRVDSADGAAAVLKVSNAADEPAVIDMQCEALRHVERQDPGLPVMRLVPTVDGAASAVIEGRDGTAHAVRMLTVVPGGAADPATLDHEALRGFGRVAARTGRALRGFAHPAAHRDLLWDLRLTPRLRSLLDTVARPDLRARAERVLDRFDREVAGVFEGLRAQPIHNDLTVDNVLTDGRGRVTGIVDFGDLTHTALVCDLAVALASLMSSRPDPIEAAEAVIRGYVGVNPLFDEEARLLSDLVGARLVAWGVIAAWRVRRCSDNAAYITAGEDEAWELLGTLEAIGPEVVRRRLHEAAVPPVPYAPMATEALARRRSDALGGAPLSYDTPLHLVGGEGVWVTDAAGRRYLDAYNNVPVAGHAHPRVVDAIAGQSRRLNTNTRYLHEAVVALAERLVATMPGGLDTVLLANSGSEANDLAWRLAVAHTGHRGAITSAHAYHGITDATAALSPETWPAGSRPDHVETVPPPGRDTAEAPAAAVRRLAERGHGLAAAIVDPAMTSDGILPAPPDYLRGLAEAAHGAGGVLVVDEVQSGHGRCGAHLWAFEASGVTPDLVTMGKAMGNGHPVAAVVTRAEIAAALTASTEVFSTFGGNPVSCAAALAVLDLIEEQRLVSQAGAVGEDLRHGIRRVAEDCPLVGDVRGQGLLVGVELVRDPAAMRPAAAETAAVVEGLRARGVLVGSTGPGGNVLKIRPPLVFGTEHADLLVSALSETLQAQARR